MLDPTIHDPYTNEGLTDDDAEELYDLIEIAFMQGYNAA